MVHAQCRTHALAAQVIMDHIVRHISALVPYLTYQAPVHPMVIVLDRTYARGKKC